MDSETERHIHIEAERQRCRYTAIPSATEMPRDGDMERLRDREPETQRDCDTERRRDGDTGRQRDGEMEIRIVSQKNCRDTGAMQEHTDRVCFVYVL